MALIGISTDDHPCRRWKCSDKSERACSEPFEDECAERVPPSDDPIKVIKGEAVALDDSHDADASNGRKGKPSRPTVPWDCVAIVVVIIGAMALRNNDHN